MTDAFHALLDGLAMGINALASIAVFLSFTALSLFFRLTDGPVIRSWTATKAHGNVVDHEYEIERDGNTVATSFKKWFRCASPTASTSRPTRTSRSSDSLTTRD